MAPRRLPIKRHAWWLYLALVTPVALLYLLLLFPNWGRSSVAAFNAVGVSASIAIVIGVRINRPAARWPWYLIALGQALFVCGDILAYNYLAIFGVKQQPFPSIADPIYLSVYPVTAAGLLLLIRRRNPGRDWAALIDSLIVTIGLGVLSWVFLIAPYAHNSSLPLDQKLVAMAYPLMDVLVLGVAMRMAVGAGRRGPSYFMTIAGLAALLVSDSVYGWIQLHGSYDGGLLDGGWILYYVLIGTAALHPSMSTVSETAAPRVRLTRTRIVGVAVAALIAPVIEMVKASAHEGADAFVIGGGAVVLFGLVVVRMVGLARAQEATAGRERALREASEDLVTATSTGEILRAAQRAARRVAGAAALPRVVRLVDHQDDAGLLAGRQASEEEPLTIFLADLPDEIVQALRRRQSVELSNAQDQLNDHAPPTPAFAVPFLVQGELNGAILLLDVSGCSAPVRRTLELLANQVGLALESAALTEQVVRAQSERRFSALVEHSSDVILVVAPNTVVQYASPSIEHVLRYGPEELVGQPLASRVHEDDRATVHHAFARLMSRSSSTTEKVELRIRRHDGSWLDVEALLVNLLDNAAVGGIVVNLRDVTERKRFEEQLSHQAFTDQVTGLANRALFRDRVEHAVTTRREPARPLAVLFLDLDDFKSINDTFGHATGDRLLRTVSTRLASQLRAGDTIARLGGDEFAVLIEDVEADEHVSATAERLLEAVSAALTIDERDVFLQCSIGIALTDEIALGTSVDDLLRNADVAMYHAKNSGGHTYRYFEPEMQALVVEQLEVRAELKTAIEKEGLSVAYQPVIDLETNAIVGYEALLRWEHPTRGFISPAYFIPIAEESGLIIPLGRWVLERACRDAVDLQGGPGHAGQTLSVNLSARQLERADIVDVVRHALSGSGLPARRLMLEITESTMIDDVDLVVERLTALRKLGIQIAVDDFGTGYSSLNYIRRLPINMLKIDKSFIDNVVRDSEQGKLTAAIVDLARALNLRCVAEGVEQPQQLERLKELGCDLGQGYLFARPMPREDLARLLREPTLVGASSAV